MTAYILFSFFSLNIVFILLLLLSEYIYKKFNSEKNVIRSELIRKGVHCITALLFFAATYVLPQALFITLSLESLIVLIVSRQLHIFKSAHLTRSENHNWGTYLYSIGLTVIALLFYTQINAIRLAILILGFSDTLASLIGKKFPVKEYVLFEDKKSIVGSIVFFLTTLVLAIYFQRGGISNINFIFSLIFALNITFIEAASFYGTDNLGILLAAALLYSSFFFNSLLTIIGICLISVQYGKHYYHNKRSRDNF